MFRCKLRQMKVSNFFTNDLIYLKENKDTALLLEKNKIIIIVISEEISLTS